MSFSFNASGQIKHYVEVDFPSIGAPLSEFRQNTRSVNFSLGGRILVQAFGKKSPLYVGPEYRWQSFGKRKFEKEYPLLGFTDKIKIIDNYYAWNIVARFQDPTPKHIPFPYVEILAGVKTIKNKVSIDNPLYPDNPFTENKHKSSGLNLGVGVGLNHIVFNDVLVLSFEVQYLIGSKLKYVDQESIVIDPNTSTYDPANYTVNFNKTHTNQLVFSLVIIIESGVTKWW